MYPLADVTNCNTAHLLERSPLPPPQSPPPRDRSDKFALFVCLTNPAKFDKNLRLAFLLSAAPLPSLPLSASSKVSQISQPLLISRQASIFVPHFISFTFVSFPPSGPLSPSRRCGLLCFPPGLEPRPRSTVGAPALGGSWSKKTLSSPLHTGLRDETSAAADGWSSSERRARCSSRQAKERNLFKVCCCCFFCVLFFLLLVF